MNIISIGDIRRLGVKALKELIPAIVTIEGRDEFVIETPDNMIALSDLHPRVRIMLKNMENKARAGMPKPEKIYVQTYRK